MSVFRCGVDLRTHQKAIVKAFDNGRRDIIVLGSRRLGKTILAWSVLIREAMTKRGVYWYCFDEYATAKRNVWYGMTHEGIRLIDMISPAMVAQTNKEELRIELTNGSIIQLIGINKANSLVGNGIMGIVFDEYALLDYESVAYIQQSLASTNGWRILISTPRGKNHFYDIWTMAGKMPDVWARFNYHCGMPEITKYLPPGFLEKQKAEMIAKYGNDALFQQEYMTSWTTPNSGSVFGDLMNILRADGRVVPCIPSRGEHIYTAWDLGNADHTSIVLFYVDDNGYPYVFDHIENRNVDVTFYVNRLKDLGYMDRVVTHFLPHDAGYRRGAWNETYAQVLAGQGIKNVVILKKPGTVSDKLNYLRRVFAGMRIDNSCTRIMECLDKLEYEWRPKVGIWSDKPTHKNGYSDTVDSLCYMGEAILTYGLKRDEPLITAPVLENMQDDNSFLNSIAESIFVVNTDSSSAIGGIVH